MKNILTTFLVLFILMALFLGASGLYQPKTIAIQVPLPAGTPLLISTGETLASSESIVKVTVNTSMSTAAGWLVWLDTATPGVTPVAGTTAMAFYASGGVGTEVCYEGKVFDRGLSASQYTSLTQVAGTDARYVHVLQTGNQDNPSTMFIDTMR